ncbi:MAG: 50S ribosomal protein L5 [Candidatus Pacebacteria bacterium]|nr:50S ribosomal protein L5 [Candidatus Paceibacterota bacterium]
MSTNNLRKYYQEKVVGSLVKKLGLTNPLAAPRIEKIVVNVGLGEAVADKTVIEKVALILTLITGQKPKVTKARVSISTFKLREGMPIGLMVTLRRERMFDFLEKLIRIVLPRLRDFQGLSFKGFDGRGNYSLGLKEQITFPEADYDKIDKVRGLEITLVTSAGSDDKARLLFEELGMPFEKKEESEKKGK